MTHLNPELEVLCRNQDLEQRRQNFIAATHDLITTQPVSELLALVSAAYSQHFVGLEGTLVAAEAMDVAEELDLTSEWMDRYVV